VYHLHSEDIESGERPIDPEYLPSEITTDNIPLSELKSSPETGHVALPLDCIHRNLFAHPVDHDNCLHVGGRFGAMGGRGRMGRRR